MSSNLAESGVPPQPEQWRSPGGRTQESEASMERECGRRSAASGRLRNRNSQERERSERVDIPRV